MRKQPFEKGRAAKVTHASFQIPNIALSIYLTLTAFYLGIPAVQKYVNTLCADVDPYDVVVSLNLLAIFLSSDLCSKKLEYTIKLDREKEGFHGY